MEFLHSDHRETERIINQTDMIPTTSFEMPIQHLEVNGISVITGKILNHCNDPKYVFKNKTYLGSLQVKRSNLLLF